MMKSEFHIKVAEAANRFAKLTQQQQTDLCFLLRTDKWSKTEQVDMNKKLLRLLNLCRELDAEMDGVACPASAAAILNAIREIIDTIDDE